ncbi:MAG: type II toxin-antitoxin system VapC family toxin [Gemmataceae bacterium]|nr:type II toxin-antitoxin system VapC family toxin [Gemmataceae bacterium]
MRALLDTHAFLWFVLDDPQLSGAAKALVEDPANDVEVSPASYWEIAIKIRLGKYTLPQPYQTFMETQLVVNDFRILHVEPKHTALLTTLDLHHKDPFDRLLIAQAVAEQIPIVSGDVVFDQYPVRRLW